MSQLEMMWETQKRFTENFIKSTATPEEKTAYVKEMALHIIAEIDELLGATGEWKKFRYRGANVNVDGILEECVDIWKFLLNVLIVYGISPWAFVDRFVDKSELVEERYHWEEFLRTASEYEKVVAVDLDGVLAKYPENWVAYVNRNLGTTYCLEDYELGTGLPIPRDKYYELKHTFREQGFESLYVAPFEDASDFLTRLKDKDYKIVILSARPYRTYKRIQTDTIRWMKVHNLPYDAFLWDDRKHLVILKYVPKLSFMVEDDPRIAYEVARLGYRVYLRDRPYNGGFEHPGVIRVKSLSEIEVR
jgi:5'(3')-deoxyribonucleotidase